MRKIDWFFLGALSPFIVLWLVSVPPAAIVWLVN